MIALLPVFGILVLFAVIQWFLRSQTNERKELKKDMIGLLKCLPGFAALGTLVLMLTIGWFFPSSYQIGMFFVFLGFVVWMCNINPAKA